MNCVHQFLLEPDKMTIETSSVESKELVVDMTDSSLNLAFSDHIPLLFFPITYQLRVVFIFNKKVGIKCLTCI